MQVDPISLRVAGQRFKETHMELSLFSILRVQHKRSNLILSIKLLFRERIFLIQLVSSLHIFYPPPLRQLNINHTICLNHESLLQDRRGVKLSQKFSRIAQIETNIEDEGARLRSDFNTFLASVISGMSKNREQEEINIMNSR